MLLTEDHRRVVKLAKHSLISRRHPHLTLQQTTVVQQTVVIAEATGGALSAHQPHLGEELKEEGEAVKVSARARELGQTAGVDSAPHAHDDEQFSQTGKDWDVVQEGEAGEGEGVAVAMGEGQGGKEVEGEVGQPLDEFVQTLQGG